MRTGEENKNDKLRWRLLALVFRFLWGVRRVSGRRKPPPHRAVNMRRRNKNVRNRRRRHRNRGTIILLYLSFRLPIRKLFTEPTTRVFFYILFIIYIFLFYFFWSDRHVFPPWRETKWRFHKKIMILKRLLCVEYDQ